MAASELIVTNGATPATPAAGKAKLFGNPSKNLAWIDDAARVLDLIAGRAVFQATPGNPAGTTSAAGVMMGLAGAITPAFSGRIQIIISGNIANNGVAIGNGGQTQIRYGTGAAPANGAALTGTAVGGLVSSVNESTTASTAQPFSLNAIVTGLILGTAYWIDVSLAQLVAGTASLSNLSISISEI